MCGRYALFSSAERVAAMFGVAAISLPAVVRRGRFNIAPRQPIVVVRAGREAGKVGDRELAAVMWGFVPRWRGGASAEPGDHPAPINARSESAATSPVFRDALSHRRCLVPADAFYEWKQAPHTSTASAAAAKQPFAIRAKDHTPLALAAVWEAHAPTRPDDDSERPWPATAAILTRPPTPLLAAIHDRMPMIVSPEHWQAWLDPSLVDGSAAIELVRSGDVPLEAFAVSCRLNNPDVDDPACIEPLAQAPSLFDAP